MRAATNTLLDLIEDVLGHEAFAALL